jgi:hypothetical protein
VTTSAGVVTSNALVHEPWLAPVSWVAQIMPLFFVVGGFASVTQWRRMRGRGSNAVAFVRDRVERLLLPALVLVAGVGGALALLGLVGVDPRLVAQGSHWISQPLWFLATYLGTTALVPAMSWLHERAPVPTLGGLVAGAIAVDAVRAATGQLAVGIANYAFVWLALQQLGFWWADGVLMRMPRRVAVGLGAAGVVALAGLVTAGYSPELLLANNNPATVALLALGAVQVAVLRLAYGALNRLASRPRVAAISAWLNERCFSVYLWHLPAIATVVGILLLSGAWLPAPRSAGWWLTRPAFLLGVVAVTALLVALTRRVDRVRRADRRPPAGVAARGSIPLAAGGVALAVGVVVILLAVGFWPSGAAVLVLLLGAGSLALLRRATRACRAAAPAAPTPAVVAAAPAR